MNGSAATSGRHSTRNGAMRSFFKGFHKIFRKSVRILTYPGKAACISLISFYQRRLSRHTCLYDPTCSEYTKRCINNWGVVAGIVLGIYRILRCNPFSKGGIDPAPEVFWKVRWLV